MELANIIRLDNFYTQKQYEKAGNLSVNTARNRIKSGLVAYLKIDGQYLIDFVKSPPEARYYNKQQAAYTTLPAGINKDNLVHISSYCRKKGQTPDKFFSAVLSGKIFGLVIGGEVFAYKHEFETL